MFYLADRALSAVYFPAPAEEAMVPAEYVAAATPAEDNLVYLPASTIMPSDDLDTLDPPADMVTDPEETDALGEIFCGANPFCHTCDELADMAEKNIDVVDWKSPPRKKPRMGVRVPEFLSVFRPGPSCVVTIRNGWIRIFLTSGPGFVVSIFSLGSLGICTNQLLFEV